MTQNNIFIYPLYGLRSICRKLGIVKIVDNSQYYGYVELFDQQANDLVYKTLREGRPCMISKFGTTELNAVVTDLVTSGALSWAVLKNFSKENCRCRGYSPSFNCKNYRDFSRFLRITAGNFVNGSWTTFRK